VCTVTSIPLFAKQLPNSAKRLYQILRKTFFASRTFSIVLQVLRTFIYPNVPILSDGLLDPHLPKNVFYRGRRIVGPGGPAQFAKQFYQILQSNITKIIFPNSAKHYYQNLQSNITKNCEAKLPKFAKQIISCGPCRFDSLPPLTYAVPTKNHWKESPAE
jgi:hypothetical protein